MPTAKRILLIDDEESIRTLLELIFTQRGHQVVAVANGADASQAVADRSFDIVLCDVHLPDTDGVRLARTIKERHPESRIIIFSGDSGSSAAIAAARADGMKFETIEKGTGPETLLRLVEGAAA